MTTPARTDFACRRTLPATSLRLRVDGVGRVPLPVSAGRARALVAAGAPAPFGLGTRTIVDPSVRDVTEIEAARVGIDAESWDAALGPALEAIRAELGLPAGRLVARLHKLLVYGPGGFFLPHRDTERDDAMVGTLVVVLPCPHRGGALTVEHGGRTRRFVSAGMRQDTLLALAFYGDCLHEIRPVTEGHRIVLSHELHFEPAVEAGDSDVNPASGATGERTADEVIAREDALLDRVLPRFFDPARSADAGVSAPRRLVWLLDHQYSRGSLGWGRLKGEDGDWARCLHRAAARLDLRAWLALTTIRETWSTAGTGWDEYRRGYGRDWYGEDENEDENEDDGHESSDDGSVRTDDGRIVELVELVDDDRTLENMKDARGRRRDWPPMRFEDAELCLEGAMPEPDEMEHEGWMGNYGDTLERRYHRAAVVLWPEREHWRNLLDADAHTLLHELLGECDDSPEDSLAAFATLGESWPPRVRSRDSGALGAALALALHWNDAAASLRLLRGFDVAALERPLLPALVRLGAAHGADGACRLVDLWFDSSLDGPGARRARGHQTPAARDARAWLPLMPALCEEVREADADEAWRTALARLSGRLLSAALGANDAGHRADRPSRRRAASDPETARWKALLDVAVALDDPRTTDALATALLDDIERAGPEVGIALSEHLAAREDMPLGTARVRELRRRVRTSLRAALADVERADGDWSLQPPRGCGCTHCRALQRFMKAGDAQALEIRAVQEQRQHVEQRVRTAELPLGLRTVRRGSPHTLVLSKPATLFDDARREADAMRGALARLDELDRKGGR